MYRFDPQFVEPYGPEVPGRFCEVDIFRYFQSHSELILVRNWKFQSEVQCQCHTYFNVCMCLMYVCVQKK